MMKTTVNFGASKLRENNLSTFIGALPTAVTLRHGAMELTRAVYTSETRLQKLTYMKGQRGLRLSLSSLEMKIRV